MSLFLGLGRIVSNQSLAETGVSIFYVAFLFVIEALLLQ